MTFQAKSNLATMLSLILVYGIYFAVILDWAADAPVDEISWQPLMLLTILPVTVLAIITHAVLAALSPADARTPDERDQAVDLRGESLGGVVLGVGVVWGLALAAFEANVFWIGQVLLGSLVVAEIAKNARTLILYRRGF